MDVHITTNVPTVCIPANHVTTVQACQTSHTYAGAVYVSTLRLVIRVPPGIFFEEKKVSLE